MRRVDVRDIDQVFCLQRLVRLLRSRTRSMDRDGIVGA